MKSLPLIAAALVALAAATPGLAQSLQVTASTSAGASNLSSGGTVALTATDTAPSALASISIRNTGTVATSITGVAISGTSEITMVFAPNFPVNLLPNATVSFGLQYTPVSGSLVTAQVSVGYVVNNQAVTFPFSVTGASSRLGYSYSFAPSGASTDLTSGGGISFPATNIGTSTTAIVVVQNRGSAATTLQSVTVTGAGFQLSGASGPTQLAAGAQTSFGVIFTPQSTASASQGTLVIGLPSGNVSFTLTGSGMATSLAVSYTLADGNAHALTDGTAIVFPSVDVNTTGTATIDIINQGTGSGVVNSVSLSGAMFRFSNLPLLPATVATGQSIRFGIVFAPTQAGTFTGSFRIDMPGRSISGTLTASTATPTISLSYIDPDTNNILPLQDGGTLSFPNTPAGGSSSVTVVVANSGAGTGVIDSIAVNTTPPSAFQLVNLPAFPASVPTSQQVRFSVKFSPPQQQAYSAVMLISLNGHVTTINVRAQGSAAQYTYSYGPGNTQSMPGGTITMADTNVGQTTNVTVSVVNAGNADGQISTIAVTGTGYTLSDLPPLPATVRVGGSLSFTLNFTPTQPGGASGRLTIGNDTFIIAGTGVGSRLTYTYTSTTPVPVLDGGVVIFAPIDVGKVEKLQFAMQNTGTSAATISTINLSAPSTSFALDQLPALPFSLAAGATATFTINFTPGAIGNLTATLQVNNSSFTLSGSGTQPAALPSYQFQAPTGVIQPAQQPTIGLTLASPYATQINGTLTLTFVSSVFTDDPAIQFATGGRTVNFIIPANSTQALFNGNPSMALQTGTTAGSIVITPSFAMQSGFNMTPATPDTLTIPIPRTAPQLLSVSITSETTTSFTVVLNGYSTTRAMRQLDVQFTPKQGESFSTGRVTLDVTTASASWYQSATSQGLGGSFLASIPFVLQSGSSTDDLVHRLQSLSVTATNEAGVSTAVTVPIP